MTDCPALPETLPYLSGWFLALFIVTICTKCLKKPVTKKPRHCCWNIWLLTPWTGCALYAKLSSECVCYHLCSFLLHTVYCSLQIFILTCIFCTFVCGKCNIFICNLLFPCVCYISRSFSNQFFIFYFYNLIFSKRKYSLWKHVQKIKLDLISSGFDFSWLSLV